MISYGYAQKQKEKDGKNSRKKLGSLMTKFTPPYHLSPSICAACKNSFGLRKRHKVFDLTVCEICANEIRLKILRDD
jgi:hypothetical protein